MNCKELLEISKNELDFIISQGEGQFTEFKERVDKSFSKEIVAFANSTGGKILIGVNDNGERIGANLTNKLKSQIIDTALNCDPKILVSIQEIENLIIIFVPESKNKPYSCSTGFYLRIGANSQKLTRDEILQFAISQGLSAFDEEINNKFIYPNDFDDNKFSEYLTATGIKSVLNTEELLINLGVAEYCEEKLMLNNAGVLFFAVNPSKFFLSSKVVCAEFAHNNKAKILDKKVYDDGMLENIKQAINFITKRIKVEFIIKSAEREEIPQFPEEAYREAVVNAIMHRDYIDKSSDVFIEVYRNKIIITNPGGLVKWLNKEDFGKISKTRNSVIASLLARTNYVEKMGTGISRMNNAMKKAGLNELTFDYDEFTFFSTINDTNKNLENGIEVSGKIEKSSGKIEKPSGKMKNKLGESSEKTTQKTTQKSSDKLGGKLGETTQKIEEKTEESSGKIEKSSGKIEKPSGKIEKPSGKIEKSSGKIIRLLKENSKLTIPEMSKIIDVTERSIERNIENLKKKNVLKRIGPDKGGHWEIINEGNNEK